MTSVLVCIELRIWPMTPRNYLVGGDLTRKLYSEMFSRRNLQAALCRCPIFGLSVLETVRNPRIKLRRMNYFFWKVEGKKENRREVSPPRVPLNNRVTTLFAGVYNAQWFPLSMYPSIYTCYYRNYPTS